VVLVGRLGPGHRAPGPDGPGGPAARLKVLSGTIRVERLRIGSREFRPKPGPGLTAGATAELEPVPS
jgi:hypothetical protein